MESTDAELFQQARQELSSAVIGDAMDKMGFQHQFLPPAIKPLDRAMVLCGRAMPVLQADFFEESIHGSKNPISAWPYGLMLDALDELKPNEVYISTGASPSYALWGELMSVRAMHCGAAGAILDGFSRDTKGILGLGFPTFSLGGYAQDQAARGKVIDFRVPIMIGQAHIAPGDLLFGDLDGICVVPQMAEREVLNAAFDKAHKLKFVSQALENGISAKEAFTTYGII
jgi:regulator of RNase E activity RraA